MNNMQIENYGIVSAFIGFLSIFFITYLLAPIAIVVGVIYWKDGIAGKIGVVLGIINLAIMLIA